MPEIVLSNAPLLKSISGDLAALRQHAFWMFLVWAALSTVRAGMIAPSTLQHSRVKPSNDGGWIGPDGR
jgi:hypothetical protein